MIGSRYCLEHCVVLIVTLLALVARSSPVLASQMRMNRLLRIADDKIISIQLKLQTLRLLLVAASLRSLYFLLESTSRRACLAPIMQTKASIFFGLFGLSLPIDTPQRFGRRRALTTCRPSAESPSCLNIGKPGDSISLRTISQAWVNSATCERMSQATGWGSRPLGTAHT